MVVWNDIAVTDDQRTEAPGGGPVPGRGFGRIEATTAPEDGRRGRAAPGREVGCEVGCAVAWYARRMEHKVVVEIAAPPEDVWAVLSDVEQWPEWAESMSQVELVDRPQLTGSARVRISQPGMLPAVWTVTEFEQGRSFTWVSHILSVSSTAVHTIEPGAEDGTSVVTLTFTQSGLLSGLIGRLLGGKIRRYVQMEADGLRSRVES